MMPLVEARAAVGRGLAVQAPVVQAPVVAVRAQAAAAPVAAAVVVAAAAARGDNLPVQVIGPWR
jgi:hypothetical protein